MTDQACHCAVGLHSSLQSPEIVFHFHPVANMTVCCHVHHSHSQKPTPWIFWGSRTHRKNCGMLILLSTRPTEICLDFATFMRWWNYFVNCTKILSSEALFSSKCTRCRLAARLHPDQPESLSAPQDPLAVERKEMGIKEGKLGGERGWKGGVYEEGESKGRERTEGEAAQVFCNKWSDSLFQKQNECLLWYAVDILVKLSADKVHITVPEMFL